MARKWFLKSILLLTWDVVRREFLKTKHNIKDRTENNKSIFVFVMFFNLEMSIWELNKEAWPGLFGPNIISKISQPLGLLLSLLQCQISSEQVTVAPCYKEKSASRQINILRSIHSFSFFNSWCFLMLKVKKPVRLKYESIDLSMEDPTIGGFRWLNIGLC